MSQPDQVRFSAGGAGSAPRLSLNLPITSIKTSLLALSVAADDVAFVVNRSPAAIDRVEVRGAAGRASCCLLPAA